MCKYLVDCAECSHGGGRCFRLYYIICAVVRGILGCFARPAGGRRSGMAAGNSVRHDENEKRQRLDARLPGIGALSLFL